MISSRFSMVLSAFLTISALSVASAADLPAKGSWRVDEGWIGLELETAFLSQHGVRIAAHGPGNPDLSDPDASGFLFFTLDHGATTDLSLPDPAGIGSPRGRVPLNTELTIEGPAGTARVSGR